jgi:hypothetical protein
MFIVTPDEAKKNEASRSEKKKTWVFRAKNVRDFAFASSRKFIWDAMGVKLGDRTVMAMSYYPNEAEPLWSKYSTHAVAHAVEVYSKFTFDYPYPVAISVNGPVYGMEYPMLSFNGPRPEEDGTYSERTKYGLISVVIHEVGHNWFPMIVNSDERQWTWMDEGLDTYVQFLAEQSWEDEYPSRRGEAREIVSYMRSTNSVPIMTNSESIKQFGSNAYGKPATALNILRETILGREQFDFAFKEYANRWKFKRPMPADFFRSIEDAVGEDLDWFWRGWFYSTQACDIAINRVRVYAIDTGNPDVEKQWKKDKRDDEPESVTVRRNKDLPKRTDRFEGLTDFYNEFDPLDVTDQDREDFEKYVKKLKDENREVLGAYDRFYRIDLSNEGGLVMPVILAVTYEDDSVEEVRIPAEIWRQNPRNTSKMLITDKAIKSIVVDPYLETADIDLTNNFFPPRVDEARFKPTGEPATKKNPMQKAEAAEKKKREAAEKAEKAEKDAGDKDGAGDDKPEQDGDAKPGR